MKSPMLVKQNANSGGKPRRKPRARRDHAPNPVAGKAGSRHTLNKLELPGLPPPSLLAFAARQTHGTFLSPDLAKVSAECSAS